MDKKEKFLKIFFIFSLAGQVLCGMEGGRDREMYEITSLNGEVDPLLGNEDLVFLSPRSWQEVEELRKDISEKVAQEIMPKNVVLVGRKPILVFRDRKERRFDSVSSEDYKARLPEILGASIDLTRKISGEVVTAPVLRKMKRLIHWEENSHVEESLGSKRYVTFTTDGDFYIELFRPEEVFGGWRFFKELFKIISTQGVNFIKDFPEKRIVVSERKEKVSNLDESSNAENKPLICFCEDDFEYGLVCSEFLPELDRHRDHAIKRLIEYGIVHFDSKICEDVEKKYKENLSSICLMSFARNRPLDRSFCYYGVACFGATMGLATLVLLFVLFLDIFPG